MLRTHFQAITNYYNLKHNSDWSTCHYGKEEQENIMAENNQLKEINQTLTSEKEQLEIKLNKIEKIKDLKQGRGMCSNCQILTEENINNKETLLF